MKKYIQSINLKPNASTTNAILMAMSKPKTKVNELLIAKISFVGLILAFSTALVLIFGV